MPQKITHNSGAVELVDTKEEIAEKKKYKAIKKPKDLNEDEMKELVYKIAKKLNLI
jgi:hypothetical protein